MGIEMEIDNKAADIAYSNFYVNSHANKLKPREAFQYAIAAYEASKAPATEQPTKAEIIQMAKDLGIYQEPPPPPTRQPDDITVIEREDESEIPAELVRYRKMLGKLAAIYYKLESDAGHLRHTISEFLGHDLEEGEQMVNPETNRQPVQKSELKPCPFCGGEITHIESRAKSFAPPKLYHEYHHPQNDCVLITQGRGCRIASFTDDVAPRTKFIEAWNTRQPEREVVEQPDLVHIRRLITLVRSSLGRKFQTSDYLPDRFDDEPTPNARYLITEACAEFMEHQRIIHNWAEKAEIALTKIEEQGRRG